MFTGIIDQIGVIKKIENNLYTISHQYIEKFVQGESIALSGMCTTILSFTNNDFIVEIIETSRKKTIFRSNSVGDKVNLERASKIGSRNSGHFLLGHIDKTILITDKKYVEDFQLVQLKINHQDSCLVVPQGSIAIDGVSLTIASLTDDFVEISIISNTWDNTIFKYKKIGDLCNVEFDVLGKYVLRCLSKKNKKI